MSKARRNSALLLLLLTPLAGGLAAWHSRQAPPPAPRPVLASEIVRVQYRAGVDSLTAAVSSLAALPPDVGPTAAHAAFRRARRAYKRVEYLVADLLPEAETVLNGPPLPRPHETVVDATLPPTGLQVMEASLFPRLTPDADSVLAAQARLVAPTLASLRTARTDAGTADGRFFDAARQEIGRVSTLGISGFDAALSGDGIVESAEALRGVRDGIAAYRPAPGTRASAAWGEVERRLGAAVAALEGQPTFDRFDRLKFLTGYAAPAATALTALQRSLAIGRGGRTGAWSTTASTIFDTGALDPSDYAPSDAPALRPALVALGRRLFFDPRLSAGDRRSCATCHQPTRGFADGRPRARVDAGRGSVRNTPTLLNAALQPFQFADGRARALEDQVAAVLENPREMNLPLAAVVAKLRTDTSLVGAFAAAAGVPRDEAITARRVQTTLAAFVRSLVAVDSRVDRALRGDAAALSADERRGFNLFMGKAACATCHFPPTFGGSLPPALLESEPEVIGVPARRATTAGMIDPDPGVEGFDRVPIHRHAFKTPSLRNVALTAPYMHNGVFRTLEQVVDFYDRGGGAGIGIDLPNQTLSPEPLRLSRGEKRALVAFMRALTDTSRTLTPASAPLPGCFPTPPPRARAPSPAGPPRAGSRSARRDACASDSAPSPH